MASGLCRIKYIKAVYPGMQIQLGNEQVYMLTLNKVDRLLPIIKNANLRGELFKRFTKEISMLWPEIRKGYPNQWLIIEALEAHTDSNNLRHFDQLAVDEKCEDGSMAMKRYR